MFAHARCALDESRSAVRAAHGPLPQRGAMATDSNPERRDAARSRADAVRWMGLLVMALAAMGAAATAVRAADDEPVIDPMKAPIDAIIQGDYVGHLIVGEEQKPCAVQVIAEGDGKFRAALYRGGLPGEGWDKQKPEEFTGKVDGDWGVFTCSLGACTVRNASMSIEDKDAAPVGRMDRVIRESKTLGLKPFKGADHLFDSEDKDLAEFTAKENWVGAKDGEEAKTDENMLCQGANSKQRYQDQIVHVEFMLPYMPKATGQARGNSGVYLQGRYEVQVLDSYGLESKDNDCGALYTIKAPDINRCFPPLQWQTYDIKYTAAKFDAAGKKTANARITVLHNGMLIHNNVELPKATTSAPNAEGPEPGFLHLQDHGCPVRYRNIWVLNKSPEDKSTAPDSGAEKEAAPEEGSPGIHAAPPSLCCEQVAESTSIRTASRM